MAESKIFGTFAISREFLFVHILRNAKRIFGQKWMASGTMLVRVYQGVTDVSFRKSPDIRS